jgi:cation-transporting ATPase E
MNGLTTSEAAARRQAGQGNDTPLQSSRPYRQILWDNLVTFINGVFLVITLVLIVLGRLGDTAVVLFTILGSVTVNLIQEVRAKQKLDQIALLTRPKATVLRDGQKQQLDPREIVVGDILRVEPGDQIVVDGPIVGEGRIDVDESLLTGEADRVSKEAGALLYSGSFCVRGSAYYEAQRVGVESLAYQLTAGARAFRRTLTPLQREINLVIRLLLLLATFLWILVAISTFFIGDITFHEGVQRSAVIAGLVPSGLYLAITLAYALGAVRMAGQNALIQQANAVESLSHVDILCLDKTGTLTANRLHLEALYPAEGITEADLRQWLGDYAANVTSGNRTTEAIAAACPGQTRPLQGEVPFSSVYKWSALAFDDLSGIYVLGAPELLAGAVPLQSDLIAHIHAGTQQGLRMLLFAHSSDFAAASPDPDAPTLPAGLQPLGVLAFSDELRPEIRETLRGFAQAGITLKIISGDNPHTVATIAHRVGVATTVGVISGPELADMDESQFAQAAQECTIFGRITPQQKEKLVRTLRSQGHYVAMIGDGVNDVLSLKQADLGVAMESGSQITRSAADIVLLHDSFAALPYAFLEGQRIRNGIQDCIKLFMVRIFVVTLLIFSTGMVSGTFPLLIKHNGLVALITVGLPTFGLAFWARPGPPSRYSLVRAMLHFVLPSALTLALVGLAVYLGYLTAILWRIPEDALLDPHLLLVPRGALVTVMILCGLLLVPFLKPPTPAWAVSEPLSGDWRHTWLALGMAAFYGAIVLVRPLRHFFDLPLLRPPDYLFLGLVVIAWGIILRYVWRGRLLDRFLGVQLGE